MKPIDILILFLIVLGFFWDVFLLEEQYKPLIQDACEVNVK